MNPVHARGQAAVALGALQQVIAAVETGRPADKTLAELSRANRKWGSRDRRFISSLVYSYFRWRGWLVDLELPLAAALAYSLDSTTPHNAQTTLADRELPLWGHLPVADKMSALGSLLGRKLTLAALVPTWLSDRVNVADFPRLIESFQQRPPTWIRSRAGHADSVFSALAEHKGNPRMDERLPNCIACDAGVDLVGIRNKVGSVFEVQDIASQIVGFVCKPQAGESWWDVCAASGGKSLHLADLMNNKGEITATDIRASALVQLSRRVRASGCDIIHPAQAGRGPEKLFDGVLVDAPCSGIGTWSRNPDMRWRTAADVVDSCARKQMDILLHAARHVRVNGVLVYSVCTITFDETQAIAERFLSTHPNFSSVEFTNPISRKDVSVRSLTIRPGDGPGDGMFITKFERKS